MKQKRPEHCYMCPYHHKAGHKKGTALHGSKFDNWCCKFSTAAPKAVSVCLAQNGKPSNVELSGSHTEHVAMKCKCGWYVKKGGACTCCWRVRK